MAQQVYIITQPNNPNQSYVGQTATPTTYVYATTSQIPQPQTNYHIQNNRGHWRDGLFDCFSNIFPSCFMSFFFQCVIIGQISENINFAPCAFVCCGYVSFWILFLILSAYYFGFQFVIWIGIAMLIWGLRNHLRNTQRIPGSSFEDCFTSFFCQGCAIAQMARHLFQYREVCDEISCSNDGRPSYFNRQQGQNYDQTPTWQQQPQPQQIYVQPQQPQYVTPTYSQYVQPVQQPPQSSITKPGWQDYVGGASATPYVPPNNNNYNSGIVSPSNITITTAAPAPTSQYPTVVVAQPVQQLNHTPARYREEDPPV